MKTFFKKIAVFLGIITAVSATSGLVSPTPVSARSFGNCDSFLGLVPWDCDVVEDIDNEEVLKTDIAQIATNVLTDVTVIAAYLVLGYVIYGGFLYMFSSGDPTKAAAGKKTLTHAFIGLAITISAYTIFGAIRIALMGSSGNLGACNPTLMNECLDGNTMVTNLIQWVLGMAAVVAVIFIVVGAVGYITAAGDSNKLQKAKSTILYALIGLAIVGLAEILTAFVSSLVRNANESTTSSTTYITKEIAYKDKEVINEKI